MRTSPGHRQFSNGLNERRGTSPGDALQLPLHSDSAHCTVRARRQLLKVAGGRPSRDSLLTVRARSRWAGRPAAGRFQASMRRIKIQSPPGGCWCRPARQAGVMRGWITAASLGWAGDERGQDADPPVHAVRVRDVLQLVVLGHCSAVPRQISRPAIAALTWAGLIEWQTIKAQVVVQVGPRRRSRGLHAT